MKRFHVNVSVQDIDAAVRFYSALFDAEPTLLKADYARWLLDDPYLNFAVSTHGDGTGIAHLGLQVDSDAELAAVGERLQAAGNALLEQQATTCCYARSDKHWVFDPQGLAWETFRTFGDSTVYGADDPRLAAGGANAAPARAACCEGGDDEHGR